MTIKYIDFIASLCDSFIMVITEIIYRKLQVVLTFDWLICKALTFDWLFCRAAVYLWHHLLREDLHHDRLPQGPGHPPPMSGRPVQHDQRRPSQEIRKSESGKEICKS